MNAIIAVIPQISPVSPLSAWSPLIFVLAVSAIKDAFEDVQRRNSDKKVNRRKYNVLRDGAYIEIRNQDILVGDIIKIKKDEEIPCDIVLLRSKDKNGLVYVDTANLDGETNLKTFKTRPETKDFRLKDIKRLRATIQAEVNNQNLYKFHGSMKLDDNGESLALSEQNLLLRGSRLRNTKFCVGVSVYTGKNSKIMLNANEPPSKWSKTERKINKVVFGIFLFKLLCCIGCAVAHGLFESEVADVSFYLQPEPNLGNAAFRAFLVFWTYFAIFSYFIPISLIVTLEIAKLFQAIYMMWDVECVDESGEGLVVKNSNLNDEIARVNYIFCDKTGTLTENRMEFDKCTIYDRVYQETRDRELRDAIHRSGENDETSAIKEFLLILASCNTAIPNENDGTWIYQSQSPDEVCLCDFARDNDMILKKRLNTDIIIENFGEIEKYEILNVMEFSSERKRMSVILRDPSGKIFLYSKGADSVMLERLSNLENRSLIESTIVTVNRFSSTGLRTLLICKKELSDETYREIEENLKAASTLIEGRNEAIEKLQDEIETDLRLVGSTAIEDKLQKQVPETIEQFLKAGIKVWIITGDKEDTAINIATSCNLIQNDSEVAKVVNAHSVEEVYDKLQTAYEIVTTYPKVTLVIDGGSLPYALSEHKDLLLEVSKMCKAVVCCRATPIQKASVVRLIKKGTGAITLSVGDGANDVSMLMEAHIGVGIFGKEGSQAARSGDYAIRMFKDLARLVFIHGRYSLLRSSLLIQFCFYKNLAMFLVQLWYAYFCGFSGHILYDDLVMAIFNVLITSLPPLLVGIYERDVDEKILLEHPESLKQIREGEGGFTTYSFAFWVLSALYHSLIIFFFTFALFFNSTSIHASGRVLGAWEIGTIASTFGLIIVLLKFSLSTGWLNWIVHLGLWLSLIAYYMIVGVQSIFLTLTPSMWHVIHQIHTTWLFLFITVLAVVTALLPDITFMYIRRTYYTRDHHILQELKRKKPKINV